jgi:hypothetical protein
MPIGLLLHKQVYLVAQEYVAPQHSLNPLGHLVGHGVLQDVARGAILKHFTHNGVLAVAGNCKNLCAGVFLMDRPAKVEPATIGEVNI